MDKKFQPSKGGALTSTRLFLLSEARIEKPLLTFNAVHADGSIEFLYIKSRDLPSDFAAQLQQLLYNASQIAALKEKPGQPLGGDNRM